MQLQDWIQQYGVAIGGLVLAGLGAFSNQNKISSLQATGEHVRQQQELIGRKQLDLQLSKKAADEASETAKSRYKSGCVMVVATADPSQYTSLSVGQPVVDAVRKSPLPDSTVVCDANGNTGVIKNGVVDPNLMAFTGDRTIVDAAMRGEFKYQVPNQ